MGKEEEKKEEKKVEPFDYVAYRDKELADRKKDEKK